MKLIIEGDDKKVARLFKEINLRIKRSGLKSSIIEATSKVQEEKPKKVESIEKEIPKDAIEVEQKVEQEPKKKKSFSGK